MDYLEYSEWLKETKGISAKSVHDYVSRLKRIVKLIGEENINDKTLTILECNNNFQNFSMSVKSQMRRTLKLYIEFKAK